MPFRYALETGRKTVTLVHKGATSRSSPKVPYREWGYEVAVEEFPAITW